ncbi:hypothetical protein F4802DRAFT_612197 [Xylaria palmicola]|nr:hypothetical protein F4802DRAFT_612197 [Xylaria palmicola]
MAQHPHSYGRHPAHYPPPSFPPMPGSSSVPSSYYYPQTQVGTMPPANFATSQSAYTHNSTSIPGLGLSGGPVPLPAAFALNPSQQWPAQGPQPHTNSHPQSQQQPPPSVPRKPPVALQQSQSTLEEGELSEGEFEDLYDPKPSSNPLKVPLQNKPTNAANNSDSRDGSIGDADGSSIYDPHDPHVIHDRNVQAAPSSAVQDYPPDDEWEPSLPERERSGSYSPYLSPREVHRRHSIAKAVSRDTKPTERAESSQNPQHTGPTIFNTTSHNADQNSTSQRETYAIGSSSFRSSLETKKKAQEAILGLWPLKVRYQDYIDEGVNTDVVKALFKDLGLDVPIAKTTTALAKSVNEVQSTPSKATASPNLTQKPQNPSSYKTQATAPEAEQSNKKDGQDKSGEAKVPVKSAAEERKDKIARKLAAMAQKTTVSQPTGQGASTPTTAPAPTSAASPAPTTAPGLVPVPVSEPSPAAIPVPAPSEASIAAGTKSDVTNTPSTATKTRAENNAILQQKLAALRKQQAQLAAGKARTSSNESTTASSPAPVEISLVDLSHNGNSTPKLKTAQQTLSTEPQSNAKDEGIPGLSSLFIPQQAQGPTRSLKRPVASDFDGCTPRYESLKRTRTDERLIIDVSDDEDIEMEIGSPTEEFPPADTGAVSTFPPLSEVPNRRQQESPVSSSAPTPPVNGARIDLLHKRIEETKRLIAEAEAKKAAKKSTVQLSPNSPSPAAQQRAESPNVDETSVTPKRVNDDRRNRIASYELPRVTAALREKQSKLKLLVAEAARLELEVQASLDEQQKLTMEMDGLVKPSAAVSLEPVNQQAQSKDVSPPAGQVSASDSHQESQEERLDEPQQLTREKSLSAAVYVEVDRELNNDEALQAAILIDNSHTTDVQMTDADVPATVCDSAPVADEATALDAMPIYRETRGPTEPLTIDGMGKEEQTAGGIATNDAENNTVAVSATPSSQADSESSESDVSMQQSAADVSESDGESYEPTPAQISESHATHKDGKNNAEVMEHPPFSGDNWLTARQVVDEILEEPNPNHTWVDRNLGEPENTNNEVKNRSCEEPLLLTTWQDTQENRPPALEDLLSYKSPLSYFRAYRFHPRYFEEVPGGLKSLTFSAKVDPMREVCSYALAGERCPDGPSCEYQHFDSMVVPGECPSTLHINTSRGFLLGRKQPLIITQLGSADMFMGETRTKFIEGLRRVLNELKANRVKDFDRITRAIVRHRQEFLGDKTKVLALDSGTT